MATGRVPTTANSPLTAKGDLFGYSTTQARVPVGSDGETLVADSSATTGLRWQGNFAAGKNFVINGNMAIAQRGTSAVTVSINSRVYSVDRFYGFGQPADGVFTVEQSTDVPSGGFFTNSLKATCTTADTTISASNVYFLGQIIEGGTFAPLRFGNANALAVTLSFWVKSSLTGTYCVSLRNSDGSRSYPVEYSISAADTWEKKTITITGDTTGTWLTTTGIGLRLDFTLAVGSSLTGTNATWAGANYQGTSNQVNWMSSSSARTFFLTGVQLEAGSVATAFQTSTGTLAGELAACQRYCVKVGGKNSATNDPIGVGQAAATTYGVYSIPLPVEMRTTPSLTAITAAASSFAVTNGTDGAITCSAVPAANILSPTLVRVTGTVTTGLTAGQGSIILSNNSANGVLIFTAEL